MKKLVLIFVALFFINLSNAGIERDFRVESYEEFTICSDYANAIATYGQLMWGADYWNTWYNAYGECLEMAY